MSLNQRHIICITQTDKHCLEYLSRSQLNLLYIQEQLERTHLKNIFKKYFIQYMQSLNGGC